LTGAYSGIWSSTEANSDEAEYWSVINDEIRSVIKTTSSLFTFFARKFYSEEVYLPGILASEGVRIFDSTASGPGYVYSGMALYTGHNSSYFTGAAVDLHDCLAYPMGSYLTWIGWSNVTDVEIGASAQSQTDGEGNSLAIMAQAGHATSAALLCDGYTVDVQIGTAYTYENTHAGWRGVVHIDGKNYRILEIEQLDGDVYKCKFLQVFI
jgi:hypothetical protein